MERQDEDPDLVKVAADLASALQSYIVGEMGRPVVSDLSRQEAIAAVNAWFAMRIERTIRPDIQTKG